MHAELDDAIQCLQDGVEEVKRRLSEGVREALGSEIEKLKRGVSGHGGEIRAGRED